MNFVDYYNSPIGRIILMSDGDYLTNLFFERSKANTNFDFSLYCKKELPVFVTTKKWLDQYFYSGKKPEITVPYKFKNCSKFMNDVLDCINNIGYGETITYGEIAQILAKKYNINKMSAQAVGQALTNNPICLIIPCHRVVGKHSIGGYNSGLDNKIYLLSMEKKQK